MVHKLAEITKYTEYEADARLSNIYKHIGKVKINSNLKEGKYKRRFTIYGQNNTVVLGAYGRIMLWCDRFSADKRGENILYPRIRNSVLWRFQKAPRFVAPIYNYWGLSYLLKRLPQEGIATLWEMLESDLSILLLEELMGRRDEIYASNIIIAHYLLKGADFLQRDKIEWLFSSSPTTKNIVYSVISGKYEEVSLQKALDFFEHTTSLLGLNNSEEVLSPSLLFAMDREGYF